MSNPLLLATFTVLLCMTCLGCHENERVTQVALQAAQQQAKQNELMAENHRELAAGTTKLMEAEAQARADLIDLQHDLQAEQYQLGQLRDQLEDERRQIASQRLTESRLGPILRSCAIAAFGIVTLSFCWYLLYGLQDNNADQLLNELLIEEFSSAKPTLLPRSPATNSDSHPSLTQESVR